MQCLANQISALGRDVVVVFAEDLPTFVNPLFVSQDQGNYTKTISPWMSPARAKLSSFFPSPRLWLWISVAK